MLTKMIERGATAPYHRMVAKAKKDLLEAAEAGEAKAADKAVLASGASEEEKEGGMEGQMEGEEGGEGVQGEGGAATTAPVLEEEEEEEDEDDEFAFEKRLETSVNLLKNTPLLWACVKGHLRIVWLLLIEGYSPNDLDEMGNNALHLAAVTGNVKIVKALIDDGAMPNLVNMYKNLPIDMATDKEVRELITEAMTKNASMTTADIEAKHESNLKSYTRLVNSLDTALASAASRESNPTSEAIRTLADAVRISKEWGLDEAQIIKGELLIVKLEVGQDLMADILATQSKTPMRTQSQYVEACHRLEKTLVRAESVGVDKTQVQYGRDLIKRCQIEYWICTLAERLKGIECASDANEHDMVNLKKSIQKGQALNASEEILEEVILLHKRLDCELGMSRALQSIPVVRLPMENPPPEYWQESDTGHIKETEEYPAPPADNNNEYIWEPAESFVALQKAIANLKESYGGSEASGANAALIAEAKIKLVKAEKEIKLLMAKNEQDRLAAIDVAQKALAKKKKGGKGGKK